MPGVRLTEEEEQQYLTARKTFRNVRCNELISLYILADRLLDPVTANMTIDTLRVFIKKYDFVPSTEVIERVIDSTKDDDGLRSLFADIFVYHRHDLSRCLDPNLPKEFFILIVERYEWMKENIHIAVEETNLEGFDYDVGMDRWDEAVYYQDFE